MNDLTPNSHRAHGGEQLPVSHAHGRMLADPGIFKVRAFGEDPLDGNASRYDIREYLRILIKHRILIALLLLLGVVCSLVYSLLATRLYTATASVQIDTKTMQIMKSSEVVQSGAQDQQFLQTQFQILSSRTLAERVAAQMNLVNDDDFMGRNSFSMTGWIVSFFRTRSSIVPQEINGIQRAAIIILNSTQIVPFPQTSVVRIRVTDRQPKRARDIANALANGFVSLNLDRRVDASSYARKFLEDELEQLRIKLEESERKMIEVAQREQIIGLDQDKSSLIERTLESRNTELGEATADRIKKEGLWRIASKTAGGSLPSVVENQLIQGLRSKRAELASEYQDKLGSFKPEFPSMLKLRGRIIELDRQLSMEVNTIKQSLRAAYESSRDRETTLADQVKSLKADLLDMQKRSIEYSILKRGNDTSRNLYNDLLNRYKEVSVAGNTGVSNISVVDTALMPDIPASPRITLNLILGLFTGLLVGVGTAFLKERIDDRMHSPEDVERATQLTSIGVLPRQLDGSDLVLVLSDTHSSLSEAYRSLATSLQFSTEQGLPKTLLVTSSTMGEGKSTTSYALSRYYAKIGMQVLLIDCDLRKPSLARLLNMSSDVGLSNYLSGNCTAPEAFQITDSPNLAFMSSGPLPRNPAELLSGALFQTLLTTSMSKFDVVILDGPPVMGLADAPIIASSVSGTIIVVAAGQSGSFALRNIVRRLKYARANIIGTVMTKFDSQSAGYGYGYGYGDTAYRYGDGNPEALPKPNGTG